ncbi:MAG TPA: DNA primase [Micromonosporaceae bacterium]|nr:DNA primase [Micromonosporaceae bacterium]
MRPGQYESTTEVTVARQSPQRRHFEEPDADPEEFGDLDNVDAATEPAADSLWDEVAVEPVEIALPAGVGLTLRAYRPSTTLMPTEVEGRDEEDPFDARKHRHTPDEDDDTVVILDEEFAALAAADDEDDARERLVKRRTGEEQGDAEDSAADDEDELGEEEEEEEEEEEVPAFLSHRGRLLLFKTAESLVAFVRSGAEHDLTQLDSWADVVERVQPGDVRPTEEDSYELDLVVENLRGGHDAWDLDLLIEAGEIARDVGYALRLQPVVTALAPGSPLDDLDEALRSAAAGGIGGFMGRRRLRKIGAQQASLGWRTIIGKISAAVDWRD